MHKPVYRIVSWSRRAITNLGSCCFSIELDTNFAKQARELKFTNEQQRKFQEMIQELVDYKYAKTTFLDDTAFLRSMAVEGNCACLGVSGTTINAHWGDEGSISYHGHNVDNKTQAFDLLSIFCFWIEIVEAHLTEN